MYSLQDSMIWKPMLYISDKSILAKPLNLYRMLIRLIYLTYLQDAKYVSIITLQH
jgi:hypothetical protein